MARPLVHRMVHKHDCPGFQNGSEWACPFCAHQVIYWPLHHRSWSRARRRFSTSGAMTEVPVHLDDLVLELTEADENWLTLNAIAWSGVVAR
jgi:hypothetical protein